MRPNRIKFYDSHNDFSASKVAGLENGKLLIKYIVFNVYLLQYQSHTSDFRRTRLNTHQRNSFRN